MDRTAPADHPILDLLRRRWSPRAFGAQPVATATLAAVFEAARWSQSSYNEQPWRFIVATQDQPDAYQRLLGCLIPFNQDWARTAPVIGMVCTAPRFAKSGKDNPHARYDAGAAMMALTLQAIALDLYVHQMAGFDAQRARTDLAIPAELEPTTGFALGYLGDPVVLGPALRDKEIAPRERRALAEQVFVGRFGDAAAWAR